MNRDNFKIRKTSLIIKLFLRGGPSRHSGISLAIEVCSSMGALQRRFEMHHPLLHHSNIPVLKRLTANGRWWNKQNVYAVTHEPLMSNP